MEFVNELDVYAIVLIYPDGKIEKIAKDGKMMFHMEYMVNLIKKSNRLKEIIKRNKFYIPKDKLEIKCTLTYPLDKLLAKEGIISLHNLDFDEDDIYNEIEDWERVFSITLPNEFTDEQKEEFRYITDNYDLSSGHFGIENNDEVVDIDYDEVINKLESKVK